MPELTLPYIAIELIGIVPVQIYLAYALARILTVRPQWVYALAQGVIILACVLLTLPQTSPGIMQIFGTLTLLIPALLLAKERIAHRIIVLSVAAVVIIITDLPASFTWTAIFSEAYEFGSAWMHLPMYAVFSAIHLVLLAFFMIILRNFTNRFLSPQVQCYVGEGPRYFVGFPLIQLPFLILAIFVVDKTGSWNILTVALCITGGLLCLVADMMLFVSIERFVLNWQAEQQARVLQARLSECLARYSQMAEILDQSAKMRHDLRNHLQVMQQLIQRGELDVAQGHLQTLRESLQFLDSCDESISDEPFDAAAANKRPVQVKPTGSGEGL